MARKKKNHQSFLVYLFKVFFNAQNPLVGRESNNSLPILESLSKEISANFTGMRVQNVQIHL